MKIKNKARLIISNCKNCIFCGHEASGFDLYYVCKGVTGRSCCRKYVSINSIFPILEICKGQEQVDIPHWCPILIYEGDNKYES